MGEFHCRYLWQVPQGRRQYKVFVQLNAGPFAADNGEASVVDCDRRAITSNGFAPR